jgi:hypothetical protein
MKKVIFTLMIQIFVALTTAHAQGSVFNLSMKSGSLYTVQLDNNYIAAPNRNFTFANLAPGQHYLRVFKVRYHGAPKEIYSTNVNVQFSSEVNAELAYGRYFRILSILPIAPPVVCDNHSDQWENDRPEHHGHQGPGGNVYYDQPLAMCDADFNELVRTLDNISFDSSRLNVAKQIVSNKYLTTAQVIRILDLFSFDSSRLDFAKYAYGRTVDQSRYFQTYNSFSFDSSVNELSRYIAQCG